MGPLLVVEGQISPNPLSGLSPISVCLQVHLLVLMLRHSRSTKTLSMHRPLPSRLLERLAPAASGEGLAGELAALLRHSRSTKTLSMHRPLPSMLT